MTTPQNPPGFSANAFSPPTHYRETDFKSVVDNAAGPEPQAVIVYPFSGRKFVELQPYNDED